MTWRDPLREMKLYALYPEYEGFVHQPYWLSQRYDILLDEPVSWPDLLRLIGQALLMLSIWFRQQFTSQKVQTTRPPLSEILAYPLHSSERDETHFSLN